MKVLNAFSLSMLPPERGSVEIFPLSLEEVAGALRDALVAAELGGDGVESCIGHADTAALFSGMLGIPLETNRVRVLLRHMEDAVVGQYIGPRLPEGASSLPEGAEEIRWILVRWKSAAIAASEAAAIASFRPPGPYGPRPTGPIDGQEEAMRRHQG